MAIAFVAASAVVAGSDPTVAVPTGYAEGNLLVLVGTGTNTPATPTGWTQRYAQGTGRNITVLTKYAGAIEASVALSLTGSTSKAVMLCYSGAGSYDVVGTVATGSSTSPATTSQTTTYANDYILSIYATADVSVTFTAPGSTTSRVNSAASGTRNGLLIVDELKATAGASTVRTATISAAESWAAINISFVETRTLYWVGGAGTWNTSTTGNWANSSGGTPGTIKPPVQNEIATIDSSSGTGTITCTGGVCGDLSVTASQAIILGANLSTLSVYGTLSFPSGGSFSANTNSNTITLRAESAKTITTNGKSFRSLTFNGEGGNWTLPSAVTATGTVTLSTGTLTLSTNTTTLSCDSFSSNNSNTRVIAFGTGNITTTGSGTAFTTATTTGLTYTGTPTINISNNSASATTVTAGTTGGTQNNALNFNFTVGTYALTLTTASNVNSLNFTGFTGTWAPGTAAYNIYGSVTLVSGMTYTTGTSVWSLINQANDTQVITSGGKTLYSIIQNQPFLASVQFAAGFTSLSNTYTLTDGTLDVGTNTATLSCNAFSSDNSSSRSITFGTGAINVTGNNTTVVNLSTMTGFSFSGTSNFNLNYSGSTGTRTISVGNTSGATVSNAVNINISNGNDTILPSDGSVFRNWVWTGYSGTFTHNNFNYTLYGNFTIPSAMTWSNTGTGTLTFSGNTSKTITTNGETIGNVTINSASGTVLLGSDLTVGPTRTLTVTAGTFNANNYNATTGLFSSTNTNTRTITMGSGTWTLSGTGTVWNLATTTNLTFNKDTANIVLSDTSVTARTFAGGGLTYNNLTIGGATGISTLTITGANTFATLASTKTVAHTITFPNVTTTVSDWTIAGATLQRTGASGTFTLDKLGGGEILATRLTISNSTATPSNTWYADSSIDNGGNTGWLFNTRGAGQMFLLF
jgi:hypothetical protein